MADTETAGVFGDVTLGGGPNGADEGIVGAAFGAEVVGTVAVGAESTETKGNVATVAFASAGSEADADVEWPRTNGATVADGAAIVGLGSVDCGIEAGTAGERFAVAFAGVRLGGTVATVATVAMGLLRLRFVSAGGGRSGDAFPAGIPDRCLTADGWVAEVVTDLFAGRIGDRGSRRASSNRGSSAETPVVALVVAVIVDAVVAVAALVSKVDAFAAGPSMRSSCESGRWTATWGAVSAAAPLALIAEALAEPRAVAIVFSTTSTGWNQSSDSLSTCVTCCGSAAGEGTSARATTGPGSEADRRGRSRTRGAALDALTARASDSVDS